MEKVLAKHKCEGITWTPEVHAAMAQLQPPLSAAETQKGRNTQGEGFTQRWLQVSAKWLFQSRGICQRQQSQTTQHCGWEIVPWPLPKEPVQRAESQQPGMGITCSAEWNMTFPCIWGTKHCHWKGTKPKKPHNKPPSSQTPKQPNKLCLKIGVSLNHNLDFVIPRQQCKLEWTENM